MSSPRGSGGTPPDVFDSTSPLKKAVESDLQPMDLFCPPDKVSDPKKDDVDSASVDSSDQEESSSTDQLVPVYECRKVKDIVFASSIILARVNIDVKKPELINAIVSDFSQQAVPFVSEYMDELHSSRKGRRPYPMDPEIWAIEQKITKTIKTMEAEFPNNPNWKRHLEDLDYLYIQLFRSVQFHPRLRHPGGVHHVTLK